MSDDWKNDRAEASMHELEAKNMAKSSAEFKAKKAVKVIEAPVFPQDRVELGDRDISPRGLLLIAVIAIVVFVCWLIF